MLRQRRYSAAEIKSFVKGIAERDPDLVNEFSARPESARAAEPAAIEFLPAVELEAGGEDLTFETIVLRRGRPVLRVFRDEVQEPHIDDPDSETLRERLRPVAADLKRLMPSVGRIELRNNPQYEWVGTAWLIDQDLIVTNRHVAELFAHRERAHFVFRSGADAALPQSARVDFLEEIGNDASREVTVSRVVYIAPDNGPDVALLQLKLPDPDRRGPPIRLSSVAVQPSEDVCVIGYPARDSRVPDAALMDRLYGDVYDKKRLAPGRIMAARNGLLLHDCTTLGGNSGSVLLELTRCEAVGLHFSGVFLRENRAVPATVLAQLLRERPWQNHARLGREPVSSPAPSTPASPGHTVSVSPGSTQSLASLTRDGRVLLNIPLEVSVRIGGDGAGAHVPDKLQTADTLDIESAIAALREQLSSQPEVLEISRGFRFRDGWITDEQVIVIRARDASSAAELGAPGVFGSFPVEVREADPVRLAGLELGADAEAPHRYVSNYKKRTAQKFLLRPRSAKMKLTCHVSPEAGWSHLSQFLAETQKELVVAMYDFTAPHILDAVIDAIKPSGRELMLVLQQGESIGSGEKADDIPDEETVESLREALKRRLHTAWAPVRGPNRLFDSAYHIKVAVRDGKVFWLSSGNWQSSNQPAYTRDPFTSNGDPSFVRDFNREWHVLVEDERLAGTFRAHIEQDLGDAEEFVEAPDLAAMPDVLVPEDFVRFTDEELPARVQYFKPLSIHREITIEPLLTPDNYAARTLAFVKRARRSLLIQNQSFKPGKGENEAAFQKLLECVLKKQRDGLDVRIIFRDIGDVAENLERIKSFGFDTERVRIQKNCHTKGILVDTEAVLVGSHNWTNAGTVFNRDASLIIEDVEVARYFEEIFEHDWARLARRRVASRRPRGDGARLLMADEEAAVPPGYVRLTWSEWTGE